MVYVKNWLSRNRFTPHPWKEIILLSLCGRHTQREIEDGHDHDWFRIEYQRRVGGVSTDFTATGHHLE